MLIAGQPDFTGEWRELDGTGRRMGNVEEGLAGLGLEVAVVLLRAAMGAMVGKSGALGIGICDWLEAWPGC